MASYFHLIGMLVLAGSLFGQPGPPRGGPPRGPRAGMGRPFHNPLERWLAMPPEQRERLLAQLPPRRAERIRERLERFNSLPPRERARLLRRYAYFSELLPGRQAQLRRQMETFRDTPPERRRVLAREIQRLRAMSEADRGERIASQEFRGKYSPGERRLIEDLAGVPN